MIKTLAIRLLIIVAIALYGWWSNSKINTLKADITDRETTIATLENNNKVTVATLTNYYETLLSVAKAAELKRSTVVTEYIEHAKKKPEIEVEKSLTEYDLDSISGLVNRMHEVYRSAYCDDGTRCID